MNVGQNNIIMNIKSLVVLLIIVISIPIVFISCEVNSEPFEEIVIDLTDANRNFLFNTSSARSRARINGIGPVGFIFRLGSGSFNGIGAPDGRSEKVASPILKMRSLIRKSTRNHKTNKEEGEYQDDLPDCVEEIFTINEDNSFSYTLDFGLGCNFFGEFFYGKITEEGSYEGDSFQGRTTYKEFGGEAFKLDGTYSYDGVVEGFELDSIFADSTNLDFEVIYNYGYNLIEYYFEEDSLMTVEANGSGREMTNNEGISVLSQENRFSYSTGEFFESRVVEPLFLNFNCFEENVFTNITGLETGTFIYEDITETYSVDYGDGTCDNLITVTQEDEIFTVDLGEEWAELSGGG